MLPHTSFFGAALSPWVRAGISYERQSGDVSRVRARRGVRCESYDSMVGAEKLCQDCEPVYKGFGHPFRKER